MNRPIPENYQWPKWQRWMGFRNKLVYQGKEEFAGKYAFFNGDTGELIGEYSDYETGKAAAELVWNPPKKLKKTQPIKVTAMESIEAVLKSSTKKGNYDKIVPEDFGYAYHNGRVWVRFMPALKELLEFHTNPVAEDREVIGSRDGCDSCHYCDFLKNYIGQNDLNITSEIAKQMAAEVVEPSELKVALADFKESLSSLFKKASTLFSK